ncbi:hypothetical protein FB45DRAFT_148524 [Roridomyces roridus]|uniref:Uncharacterized protein n=1 Tax=Roridomyces roridus TaxID=1738132 RepID=A0AAD7FF05_9AGAR|nr:hypothetical protein FB45DRAFT_148524 [Roridomyces roridus]
MNIDYLLTLIPFPTLLTSSSSRRVVGSDAMCALRVYHMVTTCHCCSSLASSSIGITAIARACSGPLVVIPQHSLVRGLTAELGGRERHM